MCTVHNYHKDIYFFLFFLIPETMDTGMDYSVMMYSKYKWVPGSRLQE